MIIDVTSPATSRRVAHLEAVKRDLGITDTSEDAAILQAIDVVSGEFARLMGREPWLQSYRLRLPGDGGTFLRLPVWPLVRVTQVRAGVEDSRVVDAADYEIASSSHAGERRDQLYKRRGWVRTPARRRTRRSSDTRELYYEIACEAGWAMPIDRWLPETAVRPGEYARGGSDPSLRFQATAVAAGARTGGSEPAWPTTAGDSVVDGDVTWTARRALEMPWNLWAAAVWAVKELYRKADLITAQTPGVKSLAGGGMRIEWSGDGGDSLLPTRCRTIVEAYS